MATVSSDLASKPVMGFLVEPQNQQLQFGQLGLKITVTVSWFRPQNQAGYGLSVVPQNRREGDGVGHTSRSSGLLRVKASQVRLSQSGLETDGGTTAGGERGTIAEVASRTNGRQTGRCDGLRKTLLPLLCRFSCIRPYGYCSLF
jgi:hypothetical protein